MCISHALLSLINDLETVRRIPFRITRNDGLTVIHHDPSVAWYCYKWWTDHGHTASIMRRGRTIHPSPSPAAGFPLNSSIEP